MKKAKHLTEKHLHCTYKGLKNITQFFDHKTVMELYNEISQPTVVLKHDNILLNIANFFFWPLVALFFTTHFDGNEHIFVLGHILNE